MASSNATAITGSELIIGVQGGQEVRFTRTQLAALLALQTRPSPRGYAIPTAITGKERIEANQGGVRIRLDAADISTFLAATGAIPTVTQRHMATALTGAEQVIGLQGASPITFTVAELVVIMSGAVSWILSTGFWNDSATWNDTQVWKDAA